jgi:hypothetical protein
MPRRRLAALVALAMLLLPVAVSPARGLRTGFFDGVYSLPDEQSAPWLDRTEAAGAGIVRLSVHWRTFAPARRGDFDATDPEDPAYDWASLDPVVKHLRERGLAVILTVDSAPDWAEGSNRPRRAVAGSWKPRPAALADFATALARRYDGTTPDPARTGTTLPRVRDFQLWNEPNLARYLAPQWRRAGNGYVAVSPRHYRRMLASFYSAIKAVHADNRVITGGTSPYGDPPGGERMQPATFVRGLFCFSGPALRGGGCRTRFDVLAHHPYSVGRPRRRALNRDDVSIPDLGKLRRILRMARHKHLLPRMPRMWATEISYDSRPPDPDGVPARRHARWLEEAFYLLWRSGVDTITWLQIRDAPPTPSYAASYQSGIYLRDGRAKPAARAFRFPFVVDRSSRTTRLWGRAPQAGTLVVERREGGRWRSVLRARVAARQVFDRRIHTTSTAPYRARVGSMTSLTWR